MLFQLFFVGLCASGALGTLVAKDCPPNTAEAPKGPNLITVKSMTVTGCEKTPCQFIKGKSYDFTFVLVFHEEAAPTAHWTYKSIALTPIPVPIVGAAGDLCKILQGSTCADIKPNAELTVKITQTVEKAYPVFDGDLRVIVTKDTTPQLCAQVAVSVKGDGTLGGGLIGR